MRTSTLNKTAEGVEPPYTTLAPDGELPKITGVSGSFGGDVVLTGVFTAHSAAPDQFIRGQSALIGSPALATSTKYLHSAIDDYNGTGAVIHAHKSVGTTAVGVEGGGDPLVEFASSKRSGYLTGLIKVVSQHLNASGPQLKILRFRNAAGEALMYRTPQWSAPDDVNIISMTDFIWSPSFVGPDGSGDSDSGLQLMSEEWVRFWMYSKASSEPGVRDGATLMMQKAAQSNGQAFFDYADNDGADLTVNDQRYPNPIAVRFRSADKCAMVPHPDGVAPARDCWVKSFELCYYGREEQEHEIMYQDICFTETEELVWLHTLPTLTDSFWSGKLEAVPYTNRTTSSVTIDTEFTGAFISSDDIYVTVVNSNGAESNSELLREGV